MHLPDPVFPPLLAGHAVKAPALPFQAACEGAQAGRLDAGDIVWARDTGRLDCAIVLEPDVDRDTAAEMLFVAQVALGDAIGAVAPPEIAVRYRWPDVITVNGAMAGAARLAMAGESDPDGAPRWLVVGVDVAIRRASFTLDPGADADRTTLWDEGCTELDRTGLLESFCRHFLSWIDGWGTDGFAPAHAIYLGRLENAGDGAELTVETPSGRVAGAFVGLDEHANLLFRTGAGVAMVRAVDALARRPIAVAGGADG